jgi:hypothetical protein
VPCEILKKNKHNGGTEKNVALIKKKFKKVEIFKNSYPCSGRFLLLRLASNPSSLSLEKMRRKQGRRRGRRRSIRREKEEGGIGWREGREKGKGERGEEKEEEGGCRGRREGRGWQGGEGGRGRKEDIPTQGIGWNQHLLSVMTPFDCLRSS